MKIPNLRISSQLGAGFGLVLLMMAALILFVFVRLTLIDNSNEQIMSIDWADTDMLHAVSIATRANANLTMELLMSPEDKEAINSQISVNTKIVDDALVKLDRSIRSAERRPLFDKMMEKRVTYLRSMRQVGGLVSDGRRNEAVSLMKHETLPALNALQESIAMFSDLQKAIVVTSGARIKKNIESARMSVALLGSLALLIGVAAAYFAVAAEMVRRRLLEPSQRIASEVFENSKEGILITESASTDTLGQ